MKCVIVMFDTLNRRHLPNYGCDWIKAPNFERLGRQTVTFEKSYVCSMPCMPARRDFHTARPNFLHRSWGPLEPFDDSVPEMLKEAGVYTHLCTDHYHYFEDGGATYHNRYSSYQFNRGQEGDLWWGQIANPQKPNQVLGRQDADNVHSRQHLVNSSFMKDEKDWPQYKTFADGVDFVQRNVDEDNWCLTIETFDPHEPFHVLDEYRELYKDHYENYHGPHFDWPDYRKVRETQDEVDHCRFEYASLISMCDKRLGQVLDLFDEHNLWEDTMLVVWTDHGFLLGERDMWAKCWMPFYEEVSHTPFFVWDPRTKKKNERRDTLVQPAIDLGPTLLNFFNLQPTEHMTGKNLADAIDHNKQVRNTVIFGIHGGHLNITDGQYVYMHGAAKPNNQPLFNYTLMPTHMRGPFSCESLSQAKIHERFNFTKNCKLLKIPATHWDHDEISEQERGSMLFNLEQDPLQTQALQDDKIESQLKLEILKHMQKLNAPEDQYERLGLNNLVS
ncbi:sulfatase [Planctomycetota bacterium]|nr:sulfatase [Planctomycetota bacterium]